MCVQKYVLYPVQTYRDDTAREHEYETMRYEGTDGDTIHAPMCSKGSVILERETDEGDECYVPELGGEAVRDLPGNAELVAR